MNKPCYGKVTNLSDYKMRLPLTMSLRNNDVLSFLFWKVETESQVVCPNFLPKGPTAEEALESHAQCFPL